MDNPVLYETADGIATIYLNRPEKRNAMNEALVRDLYNYIERFSEDDEQRVCIITGNGPSFCAGVDLKAIATDNIFDPRGDERDLPDIMGACSKPVIAAVNGPAVTGGFEIALNCDFIIAAESAAFADTHARVGIHPGWGMTQLLQQAVGQRMARQMSFTCQFVNAADALRLGLVNEVVPDSMLMDRAREIASHICEANQEMLLKIKWLIEYRDTTVLHESYANERKHFREFVYKHLKR